MILDSARGMNSTQQRDYTLSLELAVKALKGRHPQEIARRSGAFVTEIRGRIFLEMAVLGRRCVIPHPDIDVRWADSPDEIPPWQKALILHYLKKAPGIQLSGNLVTFQEVESGAFYMPIFRARVLKPFVEAFGPRPDSMVEAAKRSFNGEERGHGHRSVTVFAFPYVPITLVLWEGDREFPPEGTLLYDSTVSEYLSTEDITLVSEMLVRGLIECSLGGGKGKSP